MMVPPAKILQISEAGGAAVGAVDHVVRFAPRGGLITAAGMLAALVPQRHQAPQVDGDVVGLADVQRERGSGQGLAEEVAAQEGGQAAGSGDDLDDPGQDLLLQPAQRLRRPAGRPAPGRLGPDNRGGPGRTARTG
jgi:hypothetical protein